MSLADEDPTLHAPDAAHTQLATALMSLLESQLGRSYRIENLSRLSGGASRETWSFDAVTADGERMPLILRRDFPREATPGLDNLAGETEVLDRHGEYRLLCALAEAGIPVPRPVAAPGAGSPLGEAFVMQRLEGETLPRRLLRDERYAAARKRLTEEVATVLGALHRLDPERLPPLPAQPLGKQLELCRRMLDRGPEPRPVFELALRWLEENRPSPPERLSLVHGDFRNGNFLVTPEGLAAVLDWEYAHLGDPLEDLGFLCMRPWRFGHDALEAGGFGTREELLRHYVAHRGTPVDAGAVRYWEVLGNLKWGALCVARAVLHVQGVHRSLEVAAIGRRVAETEYDLLELIG